MHGCAHCLHDLWFKSIESDHDGEMVTGCRWRQVENVWTGVRNFMPLTVVVPLSRDPAPHDYRGDGDVTPAYRAKSRPVRARSASLLSTYFIRSLTDRHAERYRGKKGPRPTDQLR